LRGVPTHGKKQAEQEVHTIEDTEGGTHQDMERQ